ncbi:retrovirus-related pol polyprotein from transposon TNT 1-94 [Tanacetum coccineum]
MVPRAVLMKSGLVSINTARQNISKTAVLVNTARQVNAAHSKTTVNAARPMSYLSKTAHSTVKRPIHKNTAFKNSNINQRVNTIRGKKFNTARPKAVVNAVKGNNFNAVKASACWVWKPKHKVLDHGNPQIDLQDQGVIDSGCSRHMIGNMSYLIDYEEIDGGYVAFGGNPKGGKITGKRKEAPAASWLSPKRELNLSSFTFVAYGLVWSKFVKALRGNVLLVVTDDLAVVDHKVKVIRCDNGTEFKNREMNQFCEIKGILRQFSVARTPQQNGVAERRNRTLIEAVRTMLADSKLPTTFWAEAVNTACYVQNRVLVVKPHNKTPYELFHGRTPTLSFMRPFRCPVTILNTIDHLGKFDGKADEGFFVRYSLNSKAFRVFNSRTRIVDENFHIRFSESKPNVKGSGSDWLFDIDGLIRTMNYEPIVADTKSSHDDGSKPSSDGGKKVDEDPRKDIKCNDQEKEDNVNSTNNVNTANEVNVVGGKTSIKLTFDPKMPALEDDSLFDFSNDDEDDGVVANMNNLDTTIQVSPILTTRIHKDHPLDQMIGDLQSATQTRKISKNLEEHGFVRRTQKGNSCIEGSKLDRGYVGRASTIQVTRSLDFKGIDYDEVFSPVARIEAIRLFLAYASFKDFVVYQMDVKSAFLYGKIEEEVYVCQPPGFEDLDFPDRVYKVEKALYGLHQAPRAWYETLSTYLLDNGFQRGKIDKTLFIKRHKGDILLVQMSSMGELTFFLGLQVKQKKDGILISQDKYVAKILKKFGFIEVKIASTPMKTQKPVLKDKDGEEVDVHMYRSMIGSLMYLTSSRPDIMFAVYAYARYQVNLKVSHLHAVKRIFRYLRGKLKLGLWYLKDSLFDLVAYIDSDYARASLDRKSTTGDCQFLGCRLISWQCKKQTVIDDGKAVQNRIEVNAGDSNLMLSGLLPRSKLLMGKHSYMVDAKKIIITESFVRRDLQLADEEGSAIPTDSHHIPTIIQSSTHPQKTQQPRKPKRKDTQVPQSSGPLAQALMETKSTKPKGKGVVIQVLGESTTTISSQKSQDKAELQSGQAIDGISIPLSERLALEGDLSKQTLQA